MSWEAAHVGLEREVHKSQAECFLLPQFVLDFWWFFLIMNVILGGFWTTAAFLLKYCGLSCPVTSM